MLSSVSVYTSSAALQPKGGSESEHQHLRELYAERYPSSNLEQTNRFGENMTENSEVQTESCSLVCNSSNNNANPRVD